MSDLIEGLGTASEGSLFARAIEPVSGAKSPHPHQPEACLNCGTALVGAYCHACGQQGHVHRTIGAFMHDLVHGALHFEGKLWRTLPMLVFHPGALTRRYIGGQRARFVSPMALFLFGVFLMFAVFQMVGLTTPTMVTAPDVNEMLDSADAQTLRQRDDLIAEIEAMEPDDPELAQARAQLEDLTAAIDGIDQMQRLEFEDNSSLSFNVTGIEAIDRDLIPKWRENPGLMLYKLQSNSYKFSWLLIPLSIPFVWLLFAWKRRYKGYDHAIFVTYSLSFMTLLFITLSVMYRLSAHPVLLLTMLSLIPPIHLYKQLRGAYELSRFSAFWRLLVLSGFIWVIVVLFLQLLLLLGAF